MSRAVARKVMDMVSGIRALLFQTELELPPVERLYIGKEQVRSLYNKMFQPGGYKYENLDLQAERPTLSTRKVSGLSECQLGPDKVRITEELPQFDIEEFIGVVGTVLKGLDQCPPFMIQRCRMECLGQPNNSKNSIELLAEKVANLRDAADLFERPPSYFGMRFRFHPRSFIEVEETSDQAGLPQEEAKASVENEGSTPPAREAMADEAFVTLRFETWEDDVSSIWMEAAAMFLATEGPHQDLRQIGENIRQVYKFLTRKGKCFLDNFDCR